MTCAAGSLAVMLLAVFGAAVLLCRLIHRGLFWLIGYGDSE